MTGPTLEASTSSRGGGRTAEIEDDSVMKPAHIARKLTPPPRSRALPVSVLPVQVPDLAIQSATTDGGGDNKVERPIHEELLVGKEPTSRQLRLPSSNSRISRALQTAADAYCYSTPTGETKEITYFDAIMDQARGIPNVSAPKTPLIASSRDKSNITLPDLVAILASRSKDIVNRQQEEIRCLRLAVKELVRELQDSTANDGTGDGNAFSFLRTDLQDWDDSSDSSSSGASSIQSGSSPAAAITPRGALTKPSHPDLPGTIKDGSTATPETLMSSMTPSPATSTRSLEWTPFTGEPETNTPADPILQQEEGANPVTPVLPQQHSPVQEATHFRPEEGETPVDRSIPPNLEDVSRQLDGKMKSVELFPEDLSLSLKHPAPIVTSREIEVASQQIYDEPVEENEAIKKPDQAPETTVKSVRETSTAASPILDLAGDDEVSVCESGRAVRAILDELLDRSTIGRVPDSKKEEEDPTFQGSPMMQRFVPLVSDDDSCTTSSPMFFHNTLFNMTESPTITQQQRTATPISTRGLSVARPDTALGNPALLLPAASQDEPFADRMSFDDDIWTDPATATASNNKMVSFSEANAVREIGKTEKELAKVKPVPEAKDFDVYGDLMTEEKKDDRATAPGYDGVAMAPMMDRTTAPIENVEGQVSRSNGDKVSQKPKRLRNLRHRLAAIGKFGRKRRSSQDEAESESPSTPSRPWADDMKRHEQEKELSPQSFSSLMAWREHQNMLLEPSQTRSEVSDGLQDEVSTDMYTPPKKTRYDESPHDVDDAVDDTAELLRQIGSTDNGSQCSVEQYLPDQFLN